MKFFFLFRWRKFVEQFFHGWKYHLRIWWFHGNDFFTLGGRDRLTIFHGCLRLWNQSWQIRRQKTSAFFFKGKKRNEYSNDVGIFCRYFKYKNNKIKKFFFSLFLFFKAFGEGQANFNDNTKSYERNATNEPFETPLNGLCSPGIQIRNLKKSYKVSLFGDMVRKYKKNKYK